MGLFTPFLEYIPELRQYLDKYLADPNYLERYPAGPKNPDPSRLRWVGDDLINLDTTALVTNDGQKRQMWIPPISDREFATFQRWRKTHISEVKWDLSHIPDEMVDGEEEPMPTTEQSLQGVSKASKALPDTSNPDNSPSETQLGVRLPWLSNGSLLIRNRTLAMPSPPLVLFMHRNPWSEKMPKVQKSAMMSAGSTLTNDRTT